MLSGTVRSAQGEPLEGVELMVIGHGWQTRSDAQGRFRLVFGQPGDYTLSTFAEGFLSQQQAFSLSDSGLELHLTLQPFQKELAEVQVRGRRPDGNGIAHLDAVVGTAIYEGKKSEVILLDQLVANKSTGNAREVFGKVAGINVWESDGAGLQLGIGGRGLSPNRTSNFNTRQNGYDIGADALGYPESYYTPPIDALEK